MMDDNKQKATSKTAWRSSRSKTFYLCSFKVFVTLQAPVGVVLKDTIEEYLMPSKSEKLKDPEPEQNTNNSSKEDEDGELDLTGIGKSYV